VIHNLNAGQLFYWLAGIFLVLNGVTGIQGSISFKY